MLGAHLGVGGVQGRHERRALPLQKVRSTQLRFPAPDRPMRYVALQIQDPAATPRAQDLPAKALPIWKAPARPDPSCPDLNRSVLLQSIHSGSPCSPALPHFVRFQGWWNPAPIPVFRLAAVASPPKVLAPTLKDQFPPILPGPRQQRSEQADAQPLPLETEVREEHR